MKTNLIIILCILFSNILFSQPPDWYWANSGAGDRSDGFNSVAVDGSGNVVAVGDYWSTSLVFGSTTLTNPVSSNSYNLFVVKYDALGNVLWAHSAGRNGADAAKAVTIDVSENIIVVGSFDSDTIDFGSTQLLNHTSPGCVTGCADMYIVKYDPTGNVLWAISAGGTAADNATSVLTDAMGNYLVAGNFSSTSLTFGSTTLTNQSGSSDPYFVKFDPAGNVIWARSYNGTVTPSGNITIDGSDNIFVAGTFMNPSVTWGPTTLTNAGSTDFFIGKLDSTGNQLWAHSAGGNLPEEAYCITVDQYGNIVALGNFISPSITFGTITLNNPGSSVNFRVTYDPAGNVLHANTFAEINGSVINTLTVISSGNIIGGGTFWGPTAIVGSDTLINAGIGTSDLIVVSYDSGGAVLWAKTAGGTGGEFVNTITEDPAGNIIVSGIFGSTTFNIGSVILTNTSGVGSPTDPFIAKLDTLSITGKIEVPGTRKNILLFPNPTTSLLTIYLNGYTDDVRVIILNISGEEVYASTVKDMNMFEVNVNNFAEGIYFVKTQSKNYLETAKFVLLK